MKILCLDLAKWTGYATTNGVYILSGVIDLTPLEATKAKPEVPPKLSKRDGRVLKEGRPAIPGRMAEPRSSIFGKLHRRLVKWAAEAGAEGIAVVTEAPLKHHAGVSAAEIAFGLAGVVRAFCWHHGIRHVEIDPYELQRWVLGKKADTKADEMLHEARRRLGYTGVSGDEADALWLLEWARVHVAGAGVGRTGT